MLSRCCRACCLMSRCLCFLLHTATKVELDWGGRDANTRCSVCPKATLLRKWPTRADRSAAKFTASFNYDLVAQLYATPVMVLVVACWAAHSFAGVLGYLWRFIVTEWCVAFDATLQGVFFLHRRPGKKHHKMSCKWLLSAFLPPFLGLVNSSCFLSTMMYLHQAGHSSRSRQLARKMRARTRVLRWRSPVG